MCGRVVIARCSKDLIKIAKLKNNKDMKNNIYYHESYNISPGQYLPCIYIQKPDLLYTGSLYFTLNNTDSDFYHKHKRRIPHVRRIIIPYPDIHSQKYHQAGHPRKRRRY